MHLPILVTSAARARVIRAAHCHLTIPWAVGATHSAAVGTSSGAGLAATTWLLTNRTVTKSMGNVRVVMFFVGLRAKGHAEVEKRMTKPGKPTSDKALS